jgi:hypothetical protein
MAILPDIVHPASAQSSEEWPVRLAVIVPAEKFPLESRATMVEAVLAFVASVVNVPLGKDR